MHRHTGRTHPLAPSRACLLYIIQCTHCDRKRIDVPKIETVKVENYVDGSLSLAPSSLMIWHFEIVSLLSLSFSPLLYLFFLSFFINIHYIYIYIYCTRYSLIKSVYTPMYDPSCHFFDFLFLFCGFDYPAHSIRGLTVCPPNASLRSVLICRPFSYFIFISPSPLSAMYAIYNMIPCFFCFFLKFSYGSTMSLMSWNRMKTRKIEISSQ